MASESSSSLYSKREDLSCSLKLASSFYLVKLFSSIDISEGGMVCINTAVVVCLSFLVSDFGKERIMLSKSTMAGIIKVSRGTRAEGMTNDHESEDNMTLPWRTNSSWLNP
jgi:hypothetical protein